MITGVGTDVVLISRMEKFINMGGPERYFTEGEREYIRGKKNPYETAAGIFAAKEAFLKAKGTGIAKILLKDIEIRHDQLGKPYIYTKENDGEEYHLSITHDGDYSVAFVVAERRE